MMKPCRVLVVEDDALIGLCLAEIIAGMGHEVCAVVDSQSEAITAAARFLPELLVVDGTLREGSGISAVAQILRRGFVPHIFITGDKLDDQDVNARAVILRKPFNEAALTRSIARALSSRDVDCS